MREIPAPSDKKGGSLVGKGERERTPQRWPWLQTEGATKIISRSGKNNDMMLWKYFESAFHSGICVFSGSVLLRLQPLQSRTSVCLLGDSTPPPIWSSHHYGAYAELPTNSLNVLTDLVRTTVQEQVIFCAFAKA